MMGYSEEELWFFIEKAAKQGRRDDLYFYVNKMKELFPEE